MFHATSAALIRAAAYPDDLVLPAWPDLAADQPGPWREWLEEAWALPGFAPAVTSAAPDLAAQIGRVLDGQAMQTRRLRRLVEATIRYLLRWTTRATPFGRFAGVAPVELGPRAAVHWSGRHRAAARPDDRFIAEQTARAERELPVLRAVAVMTNPLGYARGGRWVLPCARTEQDRMWDVEIELTEPVRAAVERAVSAVAFTDLAVTVADKLPDGMAEAERLLAALVNAGVLVSAIRPPMTVTDPSAHLTRHLADHAAGRLDLPDPGDQIAVDLRVGCSVTLPPAVVAAAEDAASTLTAVAPRLPGWTVYHRAFIERWGPGAAVPLREVVNVLGFPAGYRSSARRDPAAFTARDALLADLAQQSALDGCADVLLDDDLIAALRGEDPRPPIPHTELRFTLTAPTPRHLDRGAFTLTVVSGARHAGVAAARFLYLLTPDELERFRSVYTCLPAAMPGADIVQLSAPPLDAGLATLARTPQVLPVLPVGDFHPAPSWTLADLAVAGDGERLWLVSATTGRPVEPLLFNCVMLPTAQQPLVRFLTEIWTAWTAPCARFDWGHATGLPFLPRVRRGRAVLHPARWSVRAAALPGRTTSWPQWRDAWQRYRERHRLPHQVLISAGRGVDDVRLRLDLDETAHLVLLRSHLHRHDAAVLTEADGPSGWIGGRPAELLLTLTSTPPHPRRPPRPSRPTGILQHLPGRSRWLDARVFGRSQTTITDILTRLPELPAGWWFLRYPDPTPHLRLRIPLRDRNHFAAITHDLAQWAEQLHNNGLVNDYALATYRPETRHGSGPALAAAEAVFAADSRAVLGRLSGELEAAAAAGMITIAHGFTGGDGLRWLVDHVPHRSGPRLEPAQLARARHPHHGPDHELATELATALATYRAIAARDGLDTDQVLADLLHLHHARMIGVDTASERHCLRLARTIAHTHLHTNRNSYMRTNLHDQDTRGRDPISRTS
ncbi:lantibiotic dehydratase [Actinomadura litoris]|uniref:Lantibiotic dehydratase n=1 Tax=Actinomadura litoris TaxID=2678616 RepID=A0A7K1KTS1_9ACTN|nr:lantibiotic dehydratase [Actinomadura litoris]MUN35397.1 lantibiotic dehydratase [Actinomadura litoris]